MQSIILAAIAVASLALSASAQSLPNQAPFAPGTTSTASGARAKPASHHHHVKLITPNTISQPEDSPVIKVSGLGPEPNPFACLLMGP
jgi:hypothetical protein